MVLISNKNFLASFLSMKAKGSVKSGWQNFQMCRTISVGRLMEKASIKGCKNWSNKWPLKKRWNIAIEYLQRISTVYPKINTPLKMNLDQVQKICTRFGNWVIPKLFKKGNETLWNWLKQEFEHFWNPDFYKNSTFNVSKLFKKAN